ncbi:MAG: CsgG/HfaB family protein [Spirochaetota bacterium]
MKKKNIFLIGFFLFVFVVFGCVSTSIPVTKTYEDAADVLANQLKPQLQKLSAQKNIKIAILPFGGPKGKPTPFGKKMATVLQSKLFSQSWDLIERDQIDKILNEKNLSAAGIIEDKDYINTGSIAGADFIIMGTTYYGKKALITARIVNVHNGSIEGIAQVYLTFTK